MILDIIRKFYGYVQFKVTGGYPEKFLNLAVKEKYNIWDIKKINGDLFAKVSCNDYKTLRHNAKKSNSKIRILKKFGLPFFIYKKRYRFGIALGLVTFSIIMCLMPMYVWKVNIIGCESINPQEVEKAISDLGISAGTLKSSINVSMITQQAMQRLDCIAWISINLNGSNVDISVKEKQIKPEQEIKSGEPSNIVASTGGQIEHLETYSGVPVVQDGDVVMEGQLLISGVVEKLSGGNEFVDANGKVYAKTHRILSDKVKMQQTYWQDIGDRITRYRIKIFNFEIPLDFRKISEDNYRYETNNQTIKIFGYDLPIAIYKDNIYKQEQHEKALTEDEATTEIENSVKIKESEEFGGDTKIKNKEWKEGYILSGTNEYYRECHYDLIENISKKESIALNN